MHIIINWIIVHRSNITNISYFIFSYFYFLIIKVGWEFWWVHRKWMKPQPRAESRRSSLFFINKWEASTSYSKKVSAPHPLEYIYVYERERERVDGNHASGFLMVIHECPCSSCLYMDCHLYICNKPRERGRKKEKEQRGITLRDQFMRGWTPPSPMTWLRDPARIAKAFPYLHPPLGTGKNRKRYL